MKSLSGSLGKRGNDLVSGGHSTMSTVQQELGISIKAEASTLATASAELTDSYTASRLAIRLVSSDMVEMFSHASPLIREVINVDGPSYLMPAWVLSEVAPKELVWARTPDEFQIRLNVMELIE
jgi:hypothetical protein